MLDSGVTWHLSRLLNHGRNNVQKETCWLLSNIAEGTRYHIGTMIFMLSDMAAVISLEKSGEWDLKKEVTWVISNIDTGGTDFHIEALVELNFIKYLLSVLTAADARIVLVYLEDIVNILQAGCWIGKFYKVFGMRMMDSITLRASRSIATTRSTRRVCISLRLFPKRKKKSSMRTWHQW